MNKGNLLRIITFHKPEVKLPAHSAGLPGKEISFILYPLTPPIPLGRDGPLASHHFRNIPMLLRLSKNLNRPVLNASGCSTLGR
jgi:hypothetical protein